MNDLVDEEEDRRERPFRPLPSGAVRRRDVSIATWVLNAAGLGALICTGCLSAVLTGVATIAAVWTYNHWTKRLPIVGALNMGACRALSVLLGAFAAPIGVISMAMPFAAVFGLYIAAITNLARHETQPKTPLLARLLPFVVIALAIVPGIQNSLFAPSKEPAAAIFALALLGAAWLLVLLLRKPARPLPPLIGAHIRILLPLQAAACYFADPWDAGRYSALLLLAAWPISSIVSRRFYAS